MIKTFFLHKLSIIVFLVAKLKHDPLKQNIGRPSMLEYFTVYKSRFTVERIKQSKLSPCLYDSKLNSPDLFNFIFKWLERLQHQERAVVTFLLMMTPGTLTYDKYAYQCNNSNNIKRSLQLLSITFLFKRNHTLVDVNLLLIRLSDCLHADTLSNMFETSLHAMVCSLKIWLERTLLIF